MADSGPDPEWQPLALEHVKARPGSTLEKHKLIIIVG